MSFKESFKLGIESAKEAKRNDKEIDELLEKLNEDLNEITKGKIRIFETITQESPVSIAQRVAFATGTEEPRQISILAAVNPQEKKSDQTHVSLARWSRGSAGYPCRISFGNKKLICDDKESLEEGFSELLEDSGVARKIFTLVYENEEQE